MQFPKAFFITGTDTDVGKTVTAAILTLALKAAYWKPVQSGQDPYSDSQWIQQTGKLALKQIIPEAYCLSKPLSPHLAAQIDNVKIDLHSFSLPDFSLFPHLIVEGAGGLMVPLNNKHFVIDLIAHLQLPVLLVCRSTLGTINHTLLSVNTLRLHKIPVLGLVMNGPLNTGNREALEYYSQVPVIAEIPLLGELTYDSLNTAYTKYFRRD